MVRSNVNADSGARKIRVVIADDSVSVRRAVSQVLAPTYEVASAGSGSEAVKLCREFDPDVLLLDVVMPGGGGFDVLAQLNPKAQRPKVVFLSAVNDCRKAATAIELGASDYLLKPCSSTEIRDTIAAVVGEENRAAPAES